MGPALLLTFVIALNPQQHDSNLHRHRQLKVNGTNVTKEFQSRWTDAKDLEDMAELHNYKILLIPGFFSDVFSYLDRNTFLPVAQQFKDQMKWFDRAHISYEFVHLHSEDISETNAKTIRDAVRASDREVIIMSHSKGCIDSLSALLDYEELKDKVKGWIALNAPFQGTPLASDFVACEPSRWIVEKILGQLHGSVETLEELSLEGREDFNKVNQEKLEQLPKELPIIVFTDVMDKGSPEPRPLLLESGILLRLQGYPNDGVLPWQSPLLLDTDYILLKGHDHSAAVTSNEGDSFDRERFTKAIFKMMLQRIRDRKPLELN